MTIYPFFTNKMVDHTIKSPHDNASWFSRLTLSWFIPIVRGTTKEVDEAKLSALPNTIDVEASFSSLRKNWDEESKQPNPSFLKALVRSLKWQMIWLAFVFSFSTLAPLGAALILGLLVDSFDG